ncbi:MAG: hypothetical protein ACI93H_000736, partial [Psychromonas sp.]
FEVVITYKLLRTEDDRMILAIVVLHLRCRYSL